MPGKRRQASEGSPLHLDGEGGFILLDVMRTAIFGFGLVVGLCLWGVGAWQIYEANSVGGAVLVLVGAVVLIVALAWRTQQRDEGIDSLLAAIGEFFSRAR
jgi:hypothetical protein